MACCCLWIDSYYLLLRVGKIFHRSLLKKVDVSLVQRIFLLRGLKKISERMIFSTQSCFQFPSL
jgi:hypothetical protein